MGGRTIEEVMLVDAVAVAVKGVVIMKVRGRKTGGVEVLVQVLPGIGANCTNTGAS